MTLFSYSNTSPEQDRDFPCPALVQTPKQSSNRNTVLLEDVIKNDSHTHARTYIHKHIYIKIKNTQMFPFDPSTSKTFLKKKEKTSQILLSHTVAFTPNAISAALMTDTRQGFSKHRMEPSRVTVEGDYTTPMEWKSQLGQLLGL